MKSYTLFILLAGFNIYSQTIYKTVQSVNLQETREFNVQLPRDYDKHPDRTYPLVLVLDGDYLFEPVAGNIDYFGYWDQMPEAVVVGVNQAGFRAQDIAFGEIDNAPMVSCLNFYAFLKSELIPHLLKTYRINDFRILIAQGKTANFANIFLVNDPEMFDVFINLSPIFTPNMDRQVFTSLKTTTDKKWYYVATASEDFIDVKDQISSLNGQLSAINHPNIFYYFDDIPDQTHYSLVTHAIPNALEAVFSVYSPIDPEEYKTKVLSAISPCDYLETKYSAIKDIYGWEPKYKFSDVLAISNAIEQNKKWDDFKKFSRIARRNFPETVMEDFFLGRYYEENGKPEKAYKHFQSAYSKKEVGFVTRDFLWKYITQLKNDFGY